jgi:hypothetical protein
MEFKAIIEVNMENDNFLLSDFEKNEIGCENNI